MVCLCPILVAFEKLNVMFEFIGIRLETVLQFVKWLMNMHLIQVNFLLYLAMIGIDVEYISASRRLEYDGAYYYDQVEILNLENLIHL